MIQRRTMVRNSCEHCPPSTHTYAARLQPSTHAQEGPWHCWENNKVSTLAMDRSYNHSRLPKRSTAFLAEVVVWLSLDALSLSQRYRECLFA